MTARRLVWAGGPLALRSVSGTRRPRSGRCGDGARWLGPALGAALAGVGALVAAVEVGRWRALSRTDTLPAEGRGAIVVLGVPGTNAALRAAQRWRVDLALAAWRTGRCDLVVFTGAAVRSPVSEAQEMAALARGRGLDPGVIVLDERSRSTWENVTEASRLVAEHQGAVAFVVLASDALHAVRAATYWRDQHGDASPRLILADRRLRPDRLWLRVPSTLGELLHRARRRNWL